MGILNEARKVEEEIREALPTLPRINFRVTRSRRVYGLAYWWKNEIALSRPIMERHPETLKATVTHEIAHIIQMEQNPFCTEIHGRHFRDVCKMLSPIVGVSTHDLVWRY